MEKCWDFRYPKDDPERRDMVGDFIIDENDKILPIYKK